LKINLYKYQKKLFNFNSLAFAVVVLTIAISFQQYFQAEVFLWDRLRPQYNNYLIFVNSFKHLIENINLYEFYPDEYGDQYKYSPTYAFFMGLFYYLPDWLGLVCWNLLNTVVLVGAIKIIPGINYQTKSLIILFVLIELITNLQNEQSNTLMAGLMILSFGFFERKKLMLAALVIALSVIIKPFGLFACTLIALYPRKFRFVAFFFAWIIVLWALPLLVTSPDQLLEHYANWLQILQSDGTSRYGFSIFGVLHRWFAIDISKWIVLVSGLIIFCIVYLRKDLFHEYGFRILFLTSILLWVVLFNHAAESSSYIICMTGIGIWYFTQERKTLNTILAITAFLVVSLLFTDITPIQYKHYLYHYYVKTIPVILIWTRILYEMLFSKYRLLKEMELTK
jgi:hypothetical protein